MSAEKTRAVIEQELGDTPIEDVFEWIQLDSVLGSASIAQVSTCTLSRHMAGVTGSLQCERHDALLCRSTRQN